MSETVPWMFQIVDVVSFHAPGFVNYKKKGAFDSQPQVIKFTSCLSMVGGSLRYPLKIALKYFMPSI